MIRRLVCLLLLAAALTSVSVISAQAGIQATVFYLGSEGANSDSPVGVGDAVSLYAANSTESIRLSAPDELVLNYRANDSLSAAAYVASRGEQLLLVVAGTDGSRHEIDLPDLTTALVERYDQAIWLSAVDAEAQPLLLHVVPETDALARFDLPFEDAQVSFHSSGRYLLVASAAAGAVEVFRLPALESLSLSETAPYLANPAWSPQVEQFAVAAAASPEAAPDLLLVNVNTGSVQQVALPASISPRDVYIRWSATGQFLSTTIAIDASAQSSVLLIVDTETGLEQTVEQDGHDTRLISWSSDDSYALLSQSSYAGSESTTEYLLYAAADQTVRPLDMLNFVRPNLLTWHPAEPQLDILGQSILDEQFGVFEFSVEDETLLPVYVTADESFSESGLLWTADGRETIVVSPPQDPLDLLLGVDYTLNWLDRSSGTLTRLSPTSISVLPYAIQVR
jgi:hypothetical protein